jgi:hypothetical protein
MALLKNKGIWCSVSLLPGQQDTLLKEGTIPLKVGRLVSLLYAEGKNHGTH